jgi:hypothetical protein
MYFLATPHHGAASAELLSFVLRASFSGSHPFLADLHQDSPSIQQINDEFRHCAQQLSGGIYSFYETQPMSLFGIGERIIVKKSSAVTGLPNEQSVPLNANHRGVCKFDSPSDDNFLAVRNSFMVTIDKLKEACQYLLSATLLELMLFRGSETSRTASKPEAATETISLHIRATRRWIYRHG